MPDVGTPEVPASSLPSRTGVLVIGAGQAGLSMSHCLTAAGLDHVVVERSRVASEWRDSRWDSFCLVTPNWQCRLPGFSYGGDDPDGFMVRDQIVAFLESYAASFGPPVHEGVEVTALHQADGGWHAATSAGGVQAEAVVIATGGYHLPIIPPFATRLSPEVRQLHSSQYRKPDQLPAGAVLVVGSGQSGAQIAEDLHMAGRRVHLAVGDAPRCARFYRGRDVVAWLADMGHYDVPLAEHPMGEKAREKTNHYVTGRDGGRDIDLRSFAAQGMALYGRLVDGGGSQLRFDDSLGQSLDAADEVYNGINAGIDRWIRDNDVSAPPPSRYEPVWQPGREAEALDLEAAGVTSVVWAIGYRADWSWISAPVLDESGHPQHTRGVSPVDGLCFLGLPWLHTWGSGRFASVARDAAHLTEHLHHRRLSARHGTLQPTR